MTGGDPGRKKFWVPEQKQKEQRREEGKPEVCLRKRELSCLMPGEQMCEGDVEGDKLRLDLSEAVSATDPFRMKCLLIPNCKRG